MTGTYLAYILILSSWDGGMAKIENIANFEDCERLRIRTEQAAIGVHNRRPVSGACTQVNVLYLKAPEQKSPVINVQVPKQEAPVVHNRVVIRKNAP